jgi:hypothetical protein
MGLAELGSNRLSRTTSGRMKAIKVFFNIVLNPPNSRLVRLRAGESCNISHGHIGEVKEILKKLDDDPFGK